MMLHRCNPAAPIFGILVLCLSIPFGGAWAQETPLMPGASSVAVTDDAAALLVNPAALCRSVPDGGYIVWDDTEKGNFQILSGLFAARGFGLGYQVVQPQNASRIQRIVIGQGGAGRGPLWIGSRTTYQWQTLSRRAAAWRWDLGLLLRPTRSLSVGLLARDLGQTRFFDTVFKRDYTAGLGIRPLQDKLRTRLTLYADVTKPEEGGWKENARIRTGVWSEVMEGLSFGAGVEGPFEQFADERVFSLGFRFDFLQGSFGSTLNLKHGDRPARHLQALHFTTARQRTVVRNESLTKTRIGGLLGDANESGLPLPLIGGPSSSSAQPILRELKNARKDPHARGVLLELSSVKCGGLADEIRDEIHRVRAAGKPVVAFAKEMTGRTDLYIASACDRIVIDEAALAGLFGIRADVPYLGEMLDSLGIRFEKVQHGKYKTAYEQLILDRPSEGETESLNSVLDDINEHQLRLIAGERRIDRSRLEDLVSGKLWTAKQALEAGLVDSLGDIQAAQRILARLAGVDGDPDPVSARRWHYPDYEWAEGPRVAVVWLDGAIVQGKSETGLFSGNTIGSETVVKQLRDLGERRDVKAVVLRIDSGGGDGIASDEIWRAVEKLKKKGKTVVSSMSRLAGSGGYYIACNSDRIVAEPTTITGSIGVLLFKPELTGFMDRRRIHMAVYQRGDWMGLLSANHRWTDEERAHLQGVADDFYEKFLDRATAGRGMSREAIDAVGQGRIWTGRQAKDRGLVDELGGLEEALTIARNVAGLPSDCPVENIHRPISWLQAALMSGQAQTAARSASDKAALRLLGSGLLGADAQAVVFCSDHDPLAQWLFRSSVRAAVSSRAPSPLRLENPLLQVLAEQP